MPHVMWKGSISFGLVNVPVLLHAAESRNDLDFTLLDSRDHAPIGYRKINKKTGREVPAESIVRGYKTGSRFVLVTDEDLKRASPERTQKIDLVGFVDESEIDARYFMRPYFLEPEGKNAKGYALLREAIRRTDKVGIARVVIGTREHVAALVPQGDMLLLVLLRYAQELRSTEGIKLPRWDPKALRISSAEVDMATQLVNEMSMKWKPAQYRDEYRDDLLKFIAKRKKSGTVAAPASEPKEREAGKVLDLMELLRKSVKGHGKSSRSRKGA